MARTVEVTPDEWLPRGEVRVDVAGRLPLVVFGGIPGERSDVKITARGHHQVRADFVSAPAPDPHRVTPPCERYGTCGGCPLMHLDAAGQSGARRWLVHRALANEGLGDVEVRPVVPSPAGSTDFRHVIKVGFGRSAAGRVKIGAWGRHTRDVVPIPECHVAAPVLRRTMVSLAHHTLQLELPPWDGREGLLRAAVLRASRSTGEVLITLVAARKDKALLDLAEEVARGIPEVVGVWLHLNGEEGNAIFAKDDQGVVGALHLVGRDTIEDRLGAITYRIGPGDFFQTNPAMAEVLYSRVLDELQVGPNDAFVDLYSGVGGFALQAAGRAGFAVGVEEIEGAVLRAREAARANRVPAEFLWGPVAEVLPELGVRLAGTRPKVVVDPARRGLEPGVMDAIEALEPAAVGYVSCNPVAMARDLKRWVAKGWTLGPVTPFDMFPHTAHVETFVVARPPDTGETAGPRRPPVRKLVRPPSG
jgi:23S rRNA (uracil1939-C5)-methyltransferase